MHRLSVVSGDESGLCKRITYAAREEEETQQEAHEKKQDEREFADDKYEWRGDVANVVGKQLLDKEGIVRMVGVEKEGEDGGAMWATRAGEIRMWDGMNLRHTVLRSSPSPATKNVIVGLGLSQSGGADSVITCADNGDIVVTNPEPVATFSAGKGLMTSMSVSAGASPLAACGGKDILPRVWDVGMQKCLWEARRLPNDRLDMPVPVWVTDVCWLEAETLGVVSALGDVQLYDVRVGGNRRPVRATKLSHPHQAVSHLNVLCPLPPQRIATGDAHGNVSIIDLASMRVVGAVTGSRGSVRALASGLGGQFLACGGLDRFVRIYDVKRGMVVAKTFVKQSVVGLVVSPRGSLPVEGEGVPEEENDDIDDDDEDDSSDFEAWVEKGEDEEQEPHQTRTGDTKRVRQSRATAFSS